MSETAPERSSGGNVFTRKLGPLPMWAWMGIGLAVALAFYLYNKNKSSQAASQNAVNTPGGVDSSLVPQFVNQTYVENIPPPAPTTTTGPIIRTPGPRPKKPEKEPVTRTWTAIGADSTMSQVAGRLGLFETGKSTPDPSKMVPVNATAKNFMKNVYPKNHNAKIPKGAEFSYTQGSVTDKDLWLTLV